MTKLFQESGGDADSRNSEAHKILFDMSLVDVVDDMEKKSDRDFVNDLVARFEEFEGRTVISAKQLFWLRDLKDKYL